ncbi:MAG: L-threonine 3-dehydrogenase [candidate division WS1 bacterium]|jgi:threonine 3-dehydrogenase|nr:L-threonine 3-dehydrogenase [candidate division WS1 bacterium]
MSTRDRHAERPRYMRCLRKTEPEPGFHLEQATKPVPLRGEVLIRVTSAAICGTDVHIYQWDEWSANRIKPPTIIGHEFVGVVEQLGQGVTQPLEVGQRVSAEGHICCGTCYYCRTGKAHLCQSVEIIGVDRDGCFADWISMPAGNVWPIHADIPDRWASVMDPLGNAMHTVASADVAGASVLCVGAGPIGLFSVPIAKARGASRVIVSEPNAYRRGLAEAVGADLVLDPTTGDLEAAVMEVTRGMGVDVILEMSGHPGAFRQALRLARLAGTMVLLGIPSREFAIDWAEEVIFKALTLVGVNGRRMFETWYQTEEFLLTHGPSIEPVLTHTMPMEDFDTAFRYLTSGRAGKIILDFGG